MRADRGPIQRQSSKTVVSLCLPRRAFRKLFVGCGFPRHHLSPSACFLFFSFATRTRCFTVRAQWLRTRNHHFILDVSRKTIHELVKLRGSLDCLPGYYRFTWIHRRSRSALNFDGYQAIYQRFISRFFFKLGIGGRSFTAPRLLRFT